MANKLIIEWDLQQLRLVSGSASGGRVSGDGLEVTLDTPEDSRTLKAAIEKIGFAGDTADVVLPREVVSFRRVQLPTISDEELPEMVRLQAATKMTTSVSNLALDFIPMPYAPDAGMREVMLISIPNQRIKRLKASLDECGLALGKVRAAPFVVANAAIADGSVSKARDVQSVVIWVSGDRVDIVIIQNSVIEFAHSSSLTSMTEPEVLARSVKAEFNRARLTAAEQIRLFAPASVAIYAAGRVLPKIMEELRKSVDDAQLTEHPLEATVLASVKCHDADVSTLSIAAAGIISESASTVLDVDFCNPRKVIVKPDTRRQKVLLAVLAAVCIFAAAWYWRESRVSQIKAEENFIAGQLGEIRKTLRENSDVFQQANAVDTWVKRDINWLDEIQRLHEIMPGTDRVYIRDIRLQATRGGSDVGTIIAEGFAKTLLDRDALGRTLREAGYGVENLASTNNARLIDNDYPVPLSFTLSIPEDRQSRPAADEDSDADSETKTVAANE